MKNNHSRLILFMVVWLGFIPVIHAVNTVTLSSSSGSPGDEVQVDLSLSNTDKVSALQVSIPLNGTLSSYVDNSCTKSSRAGDHVVSAGVRNDTLNILVYSSTMEALSGNEGVVVSFKLKLGKEPAVFTLQPSKLILTDVSGTKIDATAVSGTVTTQCAKAVCNIDSTGFGRVPLKGSYTNNSLVITNAGNVDLVITALTFSDSNYAATTSLPLTISAGGQSGITVQYTPTVRGNETGIMKISSNAVNRLNEIKYTAQPYAVNELHVQNAEGVSDSIVTVKLNVNNMDELNGFQFEFNLSSSLQYVDGSFKLSSRATDQTAIAKIQNDTLKLMSYSSTGAVFKESDGMIASFDVKLIGQDSYYLSPYKTILSTMLDGIPTNVTSAFTGGRITIKSPYMQNDANIDMGGTAVTDTATYKYPISNGGSSDLVIDKILFDSLGFSVKEALPIIIKSGQSADITVMYSGEKAGAYKTLMQIYNNTPSKRVSNVNVTCKRFEPNFLTFSSEKVMKNDSVTIKTSLSNYTDISGFQLDLVYPNKFYSVYTGNIIKSARTQSMQIDYSQLNDSTLRVICYSLSGDIIKKGEGELFTIKFKPTANTVDSTYVFSAYNIKMGNASLKNMYSGTTSVKTEVVVFTYTLGDVDRNGKITITDAVCIINYILDTPNEVFVYEAADVDNNHKITVNDAVALIDRFILDVSATSAKSFYNSPNNNTANIEIEPFAINSNEEKTISVLLNNPDDDVTAFQFDVSLPDGITFADDGVNLSSTDTANRMSDSHVISSKVQSNGDLRVVCFSTDNASISGTHGAVATLRLKADPSLNAGIYQLTLHDIHIAHVDGKNEITPPDHVTTISVGQPTSVSNVENNGLDISVGKNKITIFTGEDTKVVVVSIDGRLIYNRNMKVGENKTLNVASGIYLVNGKKVIVK